MNKKGIELSINFIVVLILAIAVFGMGIMLFKNMFSASSELLGSSYDQIDNQIAEFSCQPGERVCISPRSKELLPGELAVFGLNIVNTFSQERDFQIYVSPNHQHETYVNYRHSNVDVIRAGFTQSGAQQIPIVFTQNPSVCDQPTFPCEINKKLFNVIYRPERITIDPQEKAKIGVGIEVPKGNINSGSYVFDVYVVSTDQPATASPSIPCNQVCAKNNLGNCIRPASGPFDGPSCWNTYGSPNGDINNIELYGGKLYKIFIEVP